MMTAGCVTSHSAGTSGAEAVCGQWLSITYSSRDTRQTQDEVRLGNGRRAGYCEGQPDTPAPVKGRRLTS